MDDPLIKCSFCGKTQHEVRKIIAGPRAFICNECTDFAWDICHEQTYADLEYKSWLARLQQAKQGTDHA